LPLEYFVFSSFVPKKSLRDIKIDANIIQSSLKRFRIIRNYMTTDTRIKAFAELGRFLKQFSSQDNEQRESKLNSKFYKNFENLILTVNIYNPWFTESNVRNAVSAIADSLEEDKLREWLSSYPNLFTIKESRKVAVIMAGNIPMVGFHDMLCVLISGNKFIGKLSSDDKLLLPFIGKVLVETEPDFSSFIEFTENKLSNIDAVIATGNNNSARYFEYYFGKYPNIIRKNRNSVAVLSGKETINELRLLGGDIFQYFGLGCRNVSKLFVPEGYDFATFYNAMIDYGHIISNNKYMNNYEYNRTVFLMSSDPTLLDNNFLLLKKDPDYSSPVGVLYYEFYKDVKDLNLKLQNEQDQIQCIVSGTKEIEGKVNFGSAQSPGLSDYADGIDTMKFLISLQDRK
jgi:hypothetical protein